MDSDSGIRTYKRNEAVVFLKTKEAFGGLSNMASGFPLVINGMFIRTSEALYQACRFPHLPEVQRLILREASPMTAKMRGKPYRNDSRPDWDQVRIKIMRWCLRVKLAQHWKEFGALLLATGERPIVEQSRKDDFWGAKPIDEVTLVGRNVLGRLLMELREQIKEERKNPAKFLRVDPLTLDNFCLLGQRIGPITVNYEWPGRKPESPQNEEQDRIVQAAMVPMFDQEVQRFTYRPDDEIDQRRRPAIQEETAAARAAFAPYASYQDSRIPWIGTIPGHWDVLRIKYLLREIDERSGSNDDVHLSMSQTHGLVASHGIENWRRQSESYDNGKRCRINDLVLNRLKAHLGVFAHAQQNGVVSPDYTVLRPIRGDNTRYLEYLFKSPSLIAEFRRLTKGIVEGFWRLYTDDLYQIRVPVPPPSEQTLILRWIEDLNRRVNQFIRAKRSLIELLNEQKQAIIHHAVTRGLDPDVRLKPSGVEWLGDVPEHWKILRCRYLVKEIDQRSVSGKETHLSMSQKHGLVPRELVEERRLMSESYVGAKLVEKQDIVLNRLKAHLGVFAQASEPGLVSPDYTVLRPLGPADSSFLEYVLRSQGFRVELRRRTKGIVEGFWRLYTDDLYSIQVPSPDKDEQIKIVRYIDSSTLDIGQTIARTEQEIDLIREYRTRLIADIVTGKIDVREAAAGLSDIPEIESSESEAGEQLVNEEIDESEEFMGEDLVG